LLELRTSQRLTPEPYFESQTLQLLCLKCLEHEVMPSL